MTTIQTETKYSARVLVIESDPTLRAGVRTILEAERYEVMEAGEAVAGCKLAREVHPDLVISAVNLPGQNGYETLSLLRESQRTADIPVLLVSDTWVTPPLVRFGMSLGAGDILMRPFKATDLLGSVQARLEYRRAVITFEVARLSRSEKEK